MSRAGRLFRRRFFARRTERARVVDEVGQAIIQRWRRGDDRAFADLFKEYRQLVYGVLYHLMPNDPDLEDVVQSAFLEVFRSLNSFEGRSRLSSWIARIALHVGYHHLRHRRTHPTDYGGEPLSMDLVDGSTGADPEAAAEQREARDHVYAILGTIAPRKRSVFILNDFQAVPQDEIAEIVGANIATVRTRLFYARREFWKKAKDDPVLAHLAPSNGPRGVEGKKKP